MKKLNKKKKDTNANLDQCYYFDLPLKYKFYYMSLMHTNLYTLDTTITSMLLANANIKILNNNIYYFLEVTAAANNYQFSLAKQKTQYRKYSQPKKKLSSVAYTNSNATSAKNNFIYCHTVLIIKKFKFLLNTLFKLSINMDRHHK